MAEQYEKDMQKYHMKKLVKAEFKWLVRANTSITPTLIPLSLQRYTIITLTLCLTLNLTPTVYLTPTSITSPPHSPCTSLPHSPCTSLSHSTHSLNFPHFHPFAPSAATTTHVYTHQNKLNENTNPGAVPMADDHHTDYTIVTPPYTYT